MFEDNPAAKERSIGLAALAAIGLGGAVAVDLLVTGGFDFGPRRAPDREQPSAYVRVVDAAGYFSDSFQSFSWDFRRPPDTSASEERLAGADDDSAPSTETDAGAGEGLYDQIAALYRESESLVEEPALEEPAYEDAPAIEAYDAYDDPEFEQPAYEEPYPDVSEKEAIASESESPW